MKDSYGRDIRYMRLSITDRCNLRCFYCMPEGICPAEQQDVLSYEELMRICRVAVSRGITRFKVTGGEPLVRPGCMEFMQELKKMPGVEQVTLTTNGLLLEPLIPELLKAGIDGVNISLDTPDPEHYQQITGHDGEKVRKVKHSIMTCAAAGLKTKVNAVILSSCREGWTELAKLAEKGIDVRFIELMPIGTGACEEAPGYREVLEILRQQYPDLQPVREVRGNGPAEYWGCPSLKGRIGFIHAVSERFCESCNRVRITCTGSLKPCLCYEQGTELKGMLREGCSEEALKKTMEEAIREKPLAHCFDRQEGISGRRTMNQIGG